MDLSGPSSLVLTLCVQRSSRSGLSTLEDVKKKADGLSERGFFIRFLKSAQDADVLESCKTDIQTAQDHFMVGR